MIHNFFWTESSSKCSILFLLLDSLSFSFLCFRFLSFFALLASFFAAFFARFSSLFRRRSSRSASFLDRALSRTVSVEESESPSDSLEEPPDEPPTDALKVSFSQIFGSQVDRAFSTLLGLTKGSSLKLVQTEKARESSRSNMDYN